MASRRPFGRQVCPRWPPLGGSWNIFGALLAPLGAVLGLPGSPREASGNSGRLRGVILGVTFGAQAREPRKIFCCVFVVGRVCSSSWSLTVASFALLKFFKPKKPLVYLKIKPAALGRHSPAGLVYRRVSRDLGGRWRGGQAAIYWPHACEMRDLTSDSPFSKLLLPSARYERRVGVSLVRAAWERRPEGPACLLSTVMLRDRPSQ